MNDSSHNKTEVKERKYENSLGPAEGAETKEATNMPIKDQDTTLSMIVLLVACLALAALAHVIV